jgi:hypothetical protein
MVLVNYKTILSCVKQIKLNNWHAVKTAYTAILTGAAYLTISSGMGRFLYGVAGMALVQPPGQLATVG